VVGACDATGVFGPWERKSASVQQEIRKHRMTGSRTHFFFVSNVKIENIPLLHSVVCTDAIRMDYPGHYFDVRSVDRIKNTSEQIEKRLPNGFDQGVIIFDSV
jgi:hypothetical protein